MKNSIFGKTKAFRIACILVGLLVFGLPLFAGPTANAPKITVMTRNLYLGADIFRVIEAAQTDSATVPYAVAQVYQTMLYTDFWARANAIADEIARAKPEVVGLQEVSQFYIQTPGDFLAGNPVQASTLVIDFYQVLDAALRARGMQYQAFKTDNADVELPMANAATGGLSDVRMVDHDYILVRRGYAAAQVLGANYQVNVGQSIGGVYVEFTRGYLGVDVTVNHRAYRFVSTHLEVAGTPDSVFRFVQSSQMQELLATLAYLDSINKKTLILVGDWNSSPTDVPGTYVHPDYGPLSYTPPYMQARAAGYLDTWILQHRCGPGYTSGFDELVSDPFAKLTERIDLIFLAPKAMRFHKVACDVVGDSVKDMIRHPGYPGKYLWPSDHAGVIADIKFFQ